MATMEPGTLLKNRYQLLELLGQGGMGEVFLAMDQTLDTKVAVKANHNLSAHASAQFIREARLLASLKQPNLPRVIDYFTEEESQYLVMDFIPGENLKVLVENHQEFTFQQILKWAEQLGNALTYLHTQNPPIFHRDIKPANIKLTPDGEVILVDFGIAKTGDPSQETQTGAWAFTPGFAPPEQVSGMRTGPYSDQFSLAATIYYLIAGKSPADSARRMMGEEELVSLINIKPNIPAYFSAAIDKALAIKPEARFSTVADFIGALLNPTPIPDPASMQKTVIGNHQPVPPNILSTSIPPVSIPVQAPVKKASPIWLILGIIGIVGIITGSFFVLKTLGIIGSANVTTETAPTSEPIIIPEITETSQVVLTENPALVTETATEAVAATEQPAVISEIGRGGKVAFVSNRQEDGYNQIWLMKIGEDSNGNLVASDAEQLTFTPGDKSKPSWSADGTKLLFTGWSTDTAANGSPYADDIWMIDFTQENHDPVDLTRLAGNDNYATFSPVGDYIAFTNYRTSDNTPQLHIIDLKRGDMKQTLLTTLGFSETYSGWTPNGNFLLYVYSTGNIDILLMRDRYSLYKDYVPFDRSSNEGRLGNVSEPSVSTDGSMVVYTRLFDTKTDIYTAAFADRGRTVTQLTDSGSDYSACWSPDGKWILFTSKRDGDEEIYIMDNVGGRITNLTNMPSVDKDPAWQPPQP